MMFGSWRKAKDGGDSLMGREPADVPSGVVIDRAVYQLDGQPPQARGGTWGNMSWTRSPFYRRTGLSITR